MAPIRRWLMAAAAAVAMCCLVPGAMVSLAPAVGAATVVAPTPPPVSNCAVVSCNRGSPPSVPLPALAVAGIFTMGTAVLAALWHRRRRRVGLVALPAGSPTPLLRPPQRLLPA
ncbi:MAG: hypothetical protein ACLPYY_01760 [Acidimicrobiales bacterium]